MSDRLTWKVFIRQVYVSDQDSRRNLKLARLPIPPHPHWDSSDETHRETAATAARKWYHATH